jgi:hypothetical protein
MQTPRYQIFHQQLKDGDHETVKFAKLLEDAGVKIPTHGKSEYEMKVGESYSVKALHSLSLLVGRALFISIVQMVKEPGQLKGSTVFALYKIIGSHPEWKLDDIASALSKISIEKIRNKIAEAKDQSAALCIALTHELTLVLGRGRGHVSRH